MHESATSRRKLLLAAALALAALLSLVVALLHARSRTNEAGFPILTWRMPQLGSAAASLHITASPATRSPSFAPFELTRTANGIQVVVPSAHTSSSSSGSGGGSGSGSSGKCMTTEGPECKFPWTYKGTELKACTKRDHHSLWCYTKTAKKNSWGHCPTTSACTGLTSAPTAAKTAAPSSPPIEWRSAGDLFFSQSHW